MSRSDKKGDKVSPKVTERAHPLPCGELPPQRLRGLEMAEHKKALSEAASFFVWSPSSLGLKGASSPFLVGPARRNRWHFSGSLLVPKENNPRPAAAHRNRRALAALNTRHLLRKPVCGLKAPLGLSCPPGTAVLSGSLLSVKREHLRPVKHFPENPKLSLSVQKTFLSLHRSTQKVASCRIDTESLTKNIIFCILSLSALA